MVLERIAAFHENAIHDWWKLLLFGALYATIGLFLAAWVFPQYASMVMVFLTVLAMAHLMHQMVDSEEAYDEENGHQEFDILVHHGRAVTMFMMLFFGMLIAYTFWYTALPWASSQTSGLLSHLNIHTLFEAQNATVARITGGSVTGHAIALNRFTTIFTNNMWVLFFSFIFGLFYGYGAIFVLSWNASVIAAAAGSAFKQASAHGLNFGQRIWEFFASWLAYMPHGVFEILAYFVAALASGILGAAIARGVWRDPEKLNRVFIDFLEFSVLSIIILFLAAIIEVWVTPALSL